MEYFKILPEEIKLEILSRIPAETVLECKLVSTTWRNLVAHPSFSKIHSNHHEDSGKLGFIALTRIYARKNYNFQYFEYNDENSDESIERIRKFNFNPVFEWNSIFLGSCNGLICYLRENTYTTCNPITREYVMFPEIKKVGMYRWAMGFGYVASTNEYKVVKIIYEKKIEFKEVYVYTLGSGNGWRNLGKLNFGIRALWHEEGIFVKGVLYWLDLHELKKIVAFNLAEEKFCEHLSPPCDLNGNGKLWVLDGCLSFVIYGFVNEAECWDVWLLKKKNDNQGMKEREGHQSLGWREMFRVFDSEEFKVFRREIFAVTKSYGVLSYGYNNINVHNPEASTWKRIVDFKEQFRGVFPHKNTLVSLKELGVEDTKTMESVEIEETESHAQLFNQL